MATLYENVHLASLTENGVIKPESDVPLSIELSDVKQKSHILIQNGNTCLHNLPISKDMEAAKFGPTGMVVNTGEKSLLLRFKNTEDLNSFQQKVANAITNKKNSIFTQRTDDSSAEQYFQFYGYLSQQQNMMQDYIRTSTYQRAMLDNTADFEGKVVMDVGAGSGILSFFAYQAGARKVYAIEASSMAKQCQALVNANKLQDKIIVIPGKIEEVEIPEQVDIIISEPMGYMLFNERMLETYLHAKKWLKPGGKMFPTTGDLHISPFTDDALYMEQFSKANFWYQPSFHGVDLSNLRQEAVKEYFKQPIVDTFDIRICLATSQKYTVDFQTAHEKDLHNIEIPVTFTIKQSGTVHGLAFWFDVAFLGSQNTVWLSTAPTQPLTHWYQVRCLLQNPIFVKQGQTLAGKVVLRANTRQSYDVDIDLTVPGTNTKSSDTLDLKNPFFRYTGQQPQPPPGTNSTSPSDAYWNQEASQGLLDFYLDPDYSQTGQFDPNQQSWNTLGDSVAQMQMNYGINSMLNGAMDTSTQQQQQHQHQHQQPQQQQQQQQHHQTGVAQQNLVHLGSAPVNPGSIPAATVVSQAMQCRTSVGGGISPSLFIAPNNSSGSYPVSNQFMIGDYVIPGSMVLPTQGLQNVAYNKGNNLQ